jgi:hypothetical protein
MRRTILLAALLLAPLVSACDDDDDGTGVVGANVTGTYTLRTIDGQNLPFILLNVPGYRIEVLADAYTLNSGGDFSSTTSYRETEGTVVSTSEDTYTGTWVQNGSTINLNSTDNGPETATFSGGNTLTFTAGGRTAIYRK